PLACLPAPRAPLFPYTTLFRSWPAPDRGDRASGPKLRVSQLGHGARGGGGRASGHLLAATGGGVPGIPLLLRRWARRHSRGIPRSEEHTSELQSHLNLVCRLLL